MIFSAKDHTFVIPCFGQSSHLEHCISSLKSQSVCGSIIMTTGKKNSYLAEISKKYTIPLFINPSGKQGIGNDWNFALEQANSPLVTLAHQDDYYYPQYLEKCLERANTSNDPLIVFTAYSHFNENTKLILNIKNIILTLFFPFQKRLNNNFLKRLFLSFGSPIACPSVMYVRNKLPPEGPFSARLQLTLDWDLWLKMAGLPGDFLYESTVLLKHRIHPEAQTFIGIKEGKRKLEDYQMFKSIWPQPLAYILFQLYRLSYNHQTKRDE